MKILAKFCLSNLMVDVTPIGHLGWKFMQLLKETAHLIDSPG